MGREEASRKLDRYELAQAAEQRFESLSGGQQARFQILLLELSGATLLLLDEPTDNLDMESAEALEHGLDAFEGTVVAVTHDRWFARSFDRFLVFGADGAVYEADEPVWDEAPGGAGPVIGPEQGLASFERLTDEVADLLAEADVGCAGAACPGWTVADLVGPPRRDPPLGRARIRAGNPDARRWRLR